MWEKPGNGNFTGLLEQFLSGMSSVIKHGGPLGNPRTAMFD